MNNLIYFIFGLLTSLLFPPYFFLPLGFIIFPSLCFLLDSNEDAQDKLYGYHRLKDPRVVVFDEEKKFRVLKKSEYESSITRPERTPIMVDRNDPNVLGEPKKW